MLGIQIQVLMHAGQALDSLSHLLSLKVKLHQNLLKQRVGSTDSGRTGCPPTEEREDLLVNFWEARGTRNLLKVMGMVF